MTYYRRPTRCTIANVGDVVTAYSRTYRVVEIDDYGQAVCENLDPKCMCGDELRTLDDLDIDTVVRKDDPDLYVMDGI